MKRGLVLEGGAMRGLFTAGVLDVFMENGIRFDGIIGVSAGAAFGCNLKSGQIGRVLRYNKRYCRNWRYCSWRSLFLTGDMFGADFCYRRLPEELDPFDKAVFESSPADFFLVCTDVVSGKPVYHRCCKADRECMDWMRASASMPLVSSFVKLDGHLYLDGAITDSIPLKFMEGNGYRKNIVILTQPEGYVKKAVSIQWLLDILYRKYPALRNAMARRHILYNEQTEYVQRRKSEGAVLVIRPEQTLRIRHITHDPALLQETYDAGRRTAEKQMDQIREFMRHD
ncbi:MAG: patatin family protein [Lentisphaeria bacterium]|nr:patatin family protein [Lentisphaeria bacterium]